MADFNELLQSQQAKKLVENQERLGELFQLPETQKIFDLLGKRTGGNLEQATQQAASGNTAPLMEAIRQLTQSREGSKLLQDLKTKLK